MSQTDVFRESEGFAWYKRNEAKLTPERYNEFDDIVGRILREGKIKPKKVLDFGGSNGWRADAMRRMYGCESHCYDVSLDAILEGSESFRKVKFWSILPPYRKGYFDCVVINFVLHWVSREDLFSTIAEIDSLVKIGGHIVLTDFSPSEATKVPYRHKEGLFTYKAFYDAMFTDSGIYRLKSDIVFNHDTGASGDFWTILPGQRAVCALLHKEGSCE